jgi:hypothetical protein
MYMTSLLNYAGSKQKSSKITGNATFRDIEQGEVMQRMYKRPKLGGGQVYDRRSD